MKNQSLLQPALRVALRHLRPGMVLADHIVEPGGGVLLEKKAVLNERAIAVLQRRNVAFAYVQNTPEAQAALTTGKADEDAAFAAAADAAAAGDGDGQAGAIDALFGDARAALSALADSAAAGRQQAQAAWQDAYALLLEVIAGQEVRRRIDGGPLRECIVALDEALLDGQQPLLALVQRRARHGAFDLAAHSVNVAVLALQVAATMKLAPEEQVQAGLAALLHDIGMTRLPAGTTETPAAALGLAERMQLKAHPAWGAEILGTARKIDTDVVTAVHQHHERLDGSGYPQALEGTAISRLAQIVAVADTYERFISPRLYRDPYLPYAGLKLVLGMAGRALLPDVVRALLDNLALYPVGSVVRLNTSEVAVVAGANPRVPMRPLLRILRGADGSHGGVAVDLATDRTRFIAEVLSQVDEGDDA